MITEIEDYFAKGCGRCERFDTPDCSTRRWEEGLRRLRGICLDAGLVETVKWGHPCYVHRDRNVVVLGAFRDDFRLTFVDAALMKDPDGVLERQGPHTRHPGTVRFTAAEGVGEREGMLRAYLAEAKGYVDAGVRPEKVAAALELPPELLDAMEADPELAEAFRALPPGRQRSYVIHLGSAKQSATRIRRIAKVRDRILAGKGALER